MSRRSVFALCRCLQQNAWSGNRVQPYKQATGWFLQGDEARYSPNMAHLERSGSRGVGTSTAASGQPTRGDGLFGRVKSGLPFDAAAPQHLLRRPFSAAPENQSDAPTSPSSSGGAQAEEEWQLQYNGPQATTLRTLKAVSVTTATMSILGSPLVCMTIEGNTVAKTVGATAFALFSIFTTGLLHWFTGPYIHKLWYNPATRQVKVRKLTIFAQYEDIVFNLDDIQPPTGYSPLQTFDVGERHTLYIDGNFFENKELLAALTPASEFDMPSEVSSSTKESEPKQQSQPQ